MRGTRLVGEPRDVAIARGLLRQMMAEQGVDGAGDSAVAVLSELVTNAILHGRGPVELTLTLALALGDERVEIDVRDHDPALPVQRDPDDDEESGRGFAIVEALASEWSVDRTEPGKVVRAVVPLR